MPRNTLEIECLIESLVRAVDAAHKHNKERDSYGGYSWDYFGFREIEAKEKAAEEFGKRLEAYIKSLI